MKTPFSMINEKSESLSSIMNKNTFTAYARVWRDFSEYLDEEEVHEFDDMSKSHILKFLKKYELKPYAYNQAKSAIFKILDDLICEEDIEISKYENIKKSIKSKNIKNDEKLFLTKEQLFDVRESAYTLFSDRNILERNLLIFDLMYHSMMRVDEIAQMQLSDIHMQRKRLGIRGKGAAGNTQGARSVHAYIPLTQKLIEHMGEYMRSWRYPYKQETHKPYLEHPDTMMDTAPFFTSQRGNPIHVSSIKKDICSMICHIYEQGTVPKNHGPHCIRRSVASLKYQQNKDLVLMQHMLRHSSPETTRRYLSIDQESIDQAFLQEL